ncbi:MAG TPA: hypothetical protein VF657_19760, partial [Actinoplanes sp.]
MTIDDLLRDAVHELADEADPAADLATGAMVRGRRLRQRRRAGVAVAAAVLAGAVALPYQWIQGRPGVNRPPVAAADRAATWWEAPLALPGGWVATSLASAERIPGVTLPGASTLLVLDRRSGRYQSLERVEKAWPAPRGDLVAVKAGDSGHVGQIGVRDMRDGRTRWFTADFVLDPQWSADGGRLLLTMENGFNIIDTATGKMTSHRIDGRRYRCT